MWAVLTLQCVLQVHGMDDDDENDDDFDIDQVMMPRDVRMAYLNFKRDPRSMELGELKWLATSLPDNLEIASTVEELTLEAEYSAKMDDSSSGDEEAGDDQHDGDINFSQMPQPKLFKCSKGKTFSPSCF